MSGTMKKACVFILVAIALYVIFTIAAVIALLFGYDWVSGAMDWVSLIMNLVVLFWMIFVKEFIIQEKFRDLPLWIKVVFWVTYLLNLFNAFKAIYDIIIGDF